MPSRYQACVALLVVLATGGVASAEDFLCLGQADLAAKSARPELLQSVPAAPQTLAPTVAPPVAEAGEPREAIACIPGLCPVARCTTR
jgi:hypothetical protein